MLEAQLQTAIEECARALGWLVYHTRDSRGSTAGFPDLVCVRRRSPARLIFAELKVAGRKRTPGQEEWAERLELVAAVALFATPEELELLELGPVVAYRLWSEDDWRAGTVERELRAA